MNNTQTQTQLNNSNSFSYLHELDDLIDVLDTITFEDAEDEDEDDDLENEQDVEFLFNEDDFAVDFLETALHIMDVYINENPCAVSEPNFHTTFKESIEELFFTQFEEHISLNEYIEEDLTDILNDAFVIFFSTLYQHREDSNGKEDTYFEIKKSINENDVSQNVVTENAVSQNAVSQNDVSQNVMHKVEINEDVTNEKMIWLQQQIDILRSKPQPVQRTKEWYEFRHNLITASNAYKAFESQATKNQLIYEKCQPLPSLDETSKPQPVNVNSTFHWGQKYEPLSVMLYEYLNNTTIEDFGCIRHDQYSFLGASPDGINVDPLNKKLFGRMLEIKNIVNREITGIPKKEYWIQTQLQMEVCNLDECDFLETKFVEYENYNAFCNDNTLAPGQLKGVIMYFGTPEGRPHYEYKPIDLETIEEWEDQTMEQCESNGMMWMKTCYWKLEKLSCVLILRNRKWFQDNIQGIADIWSTIERERVSGYEHRAPNRRVKKEKTGGDNEFQGSCFLKITKLTQEETENISRED